MACRLQSGSHRFEPAAGEHQWWEGKGEDLPLWPAGQVHPSIVIEPDTLDTNQCRMLMDCFIRNRDSTAVRTKDEFWDGRFLWSNNLPRSEVDALRIMQQVRHYSTLRIMQQFSPHHVVYSDTAQLVCWPPGRELRPHADNIHPDGSPNNTSHRNWSSIIYLNEDYEGGHTYFPGHGIRLQPRAGTLVMFGAGSDFVHGVTNVVRGQRYTYAGWFTRDPAWQDREAKLIY